MVGMQPRQSGSFDCDALHSARAAALHFSPFPAAEKRATCCASDKNKKKTKKTRNSCISNSVDVVLNIANHHNRRLLDVRGILQHRSVRALTHA